MNDNAPLTGIVKETYQTAKGKHGLIIDCDNPAFKYPVKGYDGTFGATLGLNVFQVGDKVEFKFEKTDFGNQFTECTIEGGHGSQQDTSFDHGANRENRADVERVVSSNVKEFDTPDIDYGLSFMENVLKIIDNNKEQYPYLNSLDSKREVATSMLIRHDRKNGR